MVGQPERQSQGGRESSINPAARCLRERQRNEDMPRPKGLATLPYIKNISELTARLLRPLGLITAHKPTATLQQQLTRTKGPIPSMGKTHVVYKIPCMDDTKHYIGQTGRPLTIRIFEHQIATKRHDQLSLVATNADDKQCIPDVPDLAEFPIPVSSITTLKTVAQPERDGE
ncbi:uncharacterized protein [Chiloscyllium punctatum]|uniref:uncharacterized protein isoform X2 n=1 Tax=Chiloscyllium punctatum TaxID=137246 RepID=UPI003B63E444